MSSKVNDLPDKGEDAGGQAADQDGSPVGVGANILSDDQVKALLDHPLLKDTISGLAESKAKSVKDRRFSKLEKELDAILGNLNLTPEQQNELKRAQDERTLAELKAAVFGNDEDGSTVDAKPGKTVGQLDIHGAFVKAGYDPANLSLDEWEWAEKFSGDQTALINALAKRRLEAASKGVGGATSVSGAMPMAQGVPVARPGDMAALQAEYEAKLSKIRAGDVSSVLALKSEYRNKGLNLF